ncbi:MAG TPA: hypothetical protein PK413_06525, partial [Thermoanaerobaculia bacterium]|nr:hypothetical protein [Thermoanaerobaculia bacterium]
SRLGPEGLAVLAIAGHPSRPKRILLGTEGSGVWRSEDGGESFERSTQGMTNVTVAALATADRELLAAVNHAGPASGLYSSIDGGRSFQAQRLGLPSVLDLASAGGRIWAATEKGLYERAPDYLWGRVVEVPEERIEQVEARSGRVVVRGARGLWERLDGRFVPLSAEGLSPRSAALLGGALWVSAGDAVYLLAGGNRQRLWAPAPAGSLTALADRMLLAGAGAAWDRRGSDGKWQRLANEEVELLATGDRRFSHLKVSREGAELFDEALGTYQPLELPVPANQLSSALLVGDRFLLGTTASGLWLAELPRPAAPDTTTSQAGGGAGAPQR